MKQDTPAYEKCSSFSISYFRIICLIGHCDSAPTIPMSWDSEILDNELQHLLCIFHIQRIISSQLSSVLMAYSFTFWSILSAACLLDISAVIRHLHHRLARAKEGGDFQTVDFIFHSFPVFFFNRPVEDTLKSSLKLKYYINFICFLSILCHLKLQVLFTFDNLSTECRVLKIGFHILCKAHYNLRNVQQILDCVS